MTLLVNICLYNIIIEKIDIDVSAKKKDNLLIVTCYVKSFGKTGVEMEALTAITVAALTVYDMCKSVDRGMSIGARLSSKTGGQSGDVFLD